MLYQSLKLTNGIWILAELRIQPGNPNYTVDHPPRHCQVIHVVLANLNPEPKKMIENEEKQQNVKKYYFSHLFLL